MNKRKAILLIEDNEEILNFNREALLMEGYDVKTAQTLEDARAKIAEAPPSAIVLDIMLPDGSGLDFCKELRERIDVPVLFLTCLNSKEPLLQGLKAGGDDYITKPYDIDELLARVEAFVRRGEKYREKTADTIEKGPLTMDVLAGKAFFKGVDALLKPKEFSLLLFLVNNEGKRFSAEELYKKIWGQHTNDSIATVKVHISRLRKKLAMDEKSPFSIETEQRRYYFWKIQD